MSKPVQAVVMHRFAASSERVFAAWLDAATLGRWMFGPAIRDEQIVRLELDPRVGGKFSFVVNRQGTVVEHVGEYLEIDRPRRLVFSWATIENRARPSRVTVEIFAHDSGSELKLTHEMPAEWAGFVDQAAASWGKMLGALARALT